jgi:beta-glucosidase
MQNVFPKGFFWGAATASHQVEGGCVNDWSRWETSPERMAFLERSGELAKHGRDNFVSGRGAGHWERYAEDTELAASLGLNALRISLEWSKIEPKEGEFDEAVLAHYLEEVRGMQARGIEPFLTLWHWPLPLWLADRGGWTHHGAPAAFAQFTARVMATLGGEVRWWITLNEPEIYSTHSYLFGIWPPQRKNPWTTLVALAHLVRAHHLAAAAIKRVRPDAMIGIAKHNIWFEPVGRSPWNALVAWGANWAWNDLLLHLTDRSSTFIGINQYFHRPVNGWITRVPGAQTSDMDWDLSPEALRRVLLGAKKFRKPMVVTEHGLADAADKHRGRFIRESIAQLARAMAEGADVRGYLHWSLLDNFEWDKGYWPKFGLIAVARETMTRTVRGSAREYGEVIREGSR